MKTSHWNPKKQLATGVFLLLLSSSVLLTESLLLPKTAQASFSDVTEENSQKNAIEALEKAGIMKGYQDGTFKPEKPISKAEFLKAALSHAGYEPAEKPYPTIFSDVPSGSWFAPYVKKALDLELLRFSSISGLFHPEETLSRLSALRILLPLAGASAPYIGTETETFFDDVPAESPYAHLAKAAKQSGILIEEEGNRLLPHRVLSRGDAAELLAKMSLYRSTGKGSSLPISSDVNVEIDDEDYSQTQSEFFTNPKFPIFLNVWTKINDQYLNQDSVSQNELVYGAIDGMVKKLEDPYSIFNEPESAQVLEEDLDGKYEGIGTVLDEYEDQFIIIGVLKDSPAEKSGLKVGDIVVKVDGVEVKTLSSEEVVSRIKGKEGTKVKLEILRETESKTFTVTRQKIALATVVLSTPAIILPSTISYIGIHQFTQETDRDFEKILTQELAKDPKGLILDLRNNPGGYVDTALGVLEKFLPQGKILTKIKTGGRLIDEKATGGNIMPSIPVIVLVNSGSASAAEIVAGALQDNAVAKLLGEQTYGKGTVQEVSTYTDGSLLKLSIAEWLTPKGKSINHSGLTPDIVVKETKDDILGKTDSQLTRAIEELQKLF